MVWVIFGVVIFKDKRIRSSNIHVTSQESRLGFRNLVFLCPASDCDVPHCKSHFANPVPSPPVCVYLDCWILNFGFLMNLCNT